MGSLVPGAADERHRVLNLVVQVQHNFLTERWRESAKGSNCTIRGPFFVGASPQNIGLVKHLVGAHRGKCIFEMPNAEAAI